VDSVLISVGLPLALAVIMFGLGLALTVADFRRVATEPRAVAAALAAQLLLLPALCFGLVLALGLDPVLAVGMMLLAASPGGTTANLFSHLFRGDIALNITLTAVNSVIAVVTLPVVVDLAIRWFRPDVGGAVGLQLDKTAPVFAVVLVPVVLGMLVRRWRPRFADAAERPVRILSAVVLVAVIIGAVLGERERIGTYLADIGIATALFCVASLTIGYLVPRLVRVDHARSVASAFEVGVHNSTLAIAVAVGVLGSTALAVPAAVYGVIMFPLAALAGVVLSRRDPDRRRPGVTRSASRPSRP
jgi:BASS family bile acid:Na+ symporter